MTWQSPCFQNKSCLTNLTQITGGLPRRSFLPSRNDTHMLTKEKIIKTLQTVKDPEVNLDIWTMGLVYDIKIEKENIKILMTYTTPFCPWGPQLNEEIEKVLKDKVGAKKVDIEITFDPPYKMPEELRVMLGI